MENIIISLTSYSKRFNTLSRVLESLKKQSLSPDNIVLWIAYKDISKLSKKIKDMVDVRFCKDIKSYKKIIPTLKEYPNSFIVTADDDIVYKNNWLETLVKCWDGNENHIASYRVRRMVFDNNKLLPYKKWTINHELSQYPSPLNLCNTGAGVLYPPNIFHDEVFNEKVFTKLCPTADDIWLYWMARLNNKKIYHIQSNSYKLKTIPIVKKDALWHINKNKNDEYIQNLIKKYGEVFK